MQKYKMTREDLQQEVREMMETINEQVKASEEFKGHIPLIESDILLANIRKLYELICKMQKFEEEVPQKPRKNYIKPATIDLFAEEQPVFDIKLNGTPATPSSSPSAPLPASAPKTENRHLKTRITINDKFIFINELFDGNLKEYNEAIETLNGFKDRTAAMEFLDLLREKNNWGQASRAFVKLKELLG